ncbi:primosomal protein N' [Aestuariibacter halophilus]|uniref:Replication restart protein PriA n=1 Tax=Fluctibacter halophilus TaxID=226011 RepID=A0ABS8G9I7_9ALTE|nr:primosomal protein N' [Aestuariibacter halophilus]MCC2617183.1 primosomal protein N' [Aestuariibacter halophilus]
MSIVKVALPVPKRQLFDYLSNGLEVPVGGRVRVSFANRTLVGVVMAHTDDSPWADKLKAVSEVLDEAPVLDEHWLTLARWLADYYLHPIGDVIHTLLPVALRKGASALPQDTECLALTPTGQQHCQDDLRRAPQQWRLIARLKDGPVALHTLREDISSAVIRACRDKGLVETTLQAYAVQSDWHAALTISDKPRPNTEQALAISAITRDLEAYTPVLLEGVTGSGKTEVYLQSIEAILKAGRQVLILVPEIGLTPQTVQRFQRRFGIDVGVLHSNLNDNQRLRVWQQARSGELGIVIGTRSAIFTPLAKPGMIIVDEEHDGSFKQQDGLRYHARDFAVVRAKMEGVPLILGTATPSLETLNNALQGRYQHLTLHARAGVATHTVQQVMDIKDQPLRVGIAPGLIERMRSHFAAGQQVMLFINRRGYAPALLCHHCGHIETCHRCERPFTVHKQLNKIQCHHCSAARPLPRQCGACGNDEIVPKGVGTEQLDAELASIFPHISRVRIDSDSVRGKSTLEEVLAAINEGRHQLLIGTQILSKGHHFPNVTLVVIVDADGALFSADFRAAEHLAQLITQLSGRAGRADKPGEMWLQTHHPGHPLLQDLLHNGYGHFARFALQERKAAGLPPFQYQVLIRAEATDARSPFAFLDELATLLRQQTDFQVLGPVPALMEKRQGRYRVQLLLQSTRRGVIQAWLATNMATFERLPSVRKVRWSIDVDPQDFM